ncbi:DUF1839 family protein [Streptomyces sp. NPDC051987]|uniref:DUF1839 family protein n=1 Tax=Streptomyces sp. NPDC051987 TaxID=3155808 RepID=UPI0034318401
MKAVVPVDADTYLRHALHGPDREWPETNCSADVWIEIIHSLGLDPTPAAACALSADFVGDQWRFLKFPFEDLRELYGLHVEEITLWRPLVQHVEEHLAGGRLLTVEADAFHLPDTVGTTYRSTHSKSTVVPNAIDTSARRLAYFHGAGYHELSDADFDAVLRTGENDVHAGLLPYVEVIVLDRVVRHESARQVDLARRLVVEHVARRPADNPVDRLRLRVLEELDRLSAQGMTAFHQFAFSTLRQCGASAELSASVLAWLTERGSGPPPSVAAAFTAAAVGAKTAQFTLARLGRRGHGDLERALRTVAAAWARGMAGAAAWAGGGGGWCDRDMG